MRKLARGIVLLGFASTLFAESFAGVWKLDPKKSTGTVPVGETVTIHQDGRMLLVEVMVVGPTLSIKYTVPVNGGVGHVIAGPYDGVFVRRMNAYTMETTYLAHGKGVRSTRAVVAKDGHSMTSTGKVLATGKPAAWHMFFEKQQ